MGAAGTGPGADGPRLLGGRGAGLPTVRARRHPAALRPPGCGRRHGGGRLPDRRERPQPRVRYVCRLDGDRCRRGAHAAPRCPVPPPDHEPLGLRGPCLTRSRRRPAAAADPGDRAGGGAGGDARDAEPQSPAQLRLHPDGQRPRLGAAVRRAGRAPRRTDDRRAGSGGHRGRAAPDGGQPDARAVRPAGPATARGPRHPGGCPGAGPAGQPGAAADQGAAGRRARGGAQAAASRPARRSRPVPRLHAHAARGRPRPRAPRPGRGVGPHRAADRPDGGGHRGDPQARRRPQATGAGPARAGVRAETAGGPAQPRGAAGLARPGADGGRRGPDRPPGGRRGGGVPDRGRGGEQRRAATDMPPDAWSR